METLEVGVDPLVVTLRFGAALALGVLLGMERERAKTESSFAGVRTLGLFALAGGVAAFLDVSLERPALALAVFAAAAGLVIVSYFVTAQSGEIGVTTELSALLAFLLGFLCVSGHVTMAAGLAVASGGILALKEWLHRLSARIESADVEATLKFAIVSIIILPLVPDQNFGPAAARRDQPLQDLADGGADLGAQLRELPAREGGGRGARHRSHRAARRARLEHGGDARLRAAQPSAAAHRVQHSRSAS